MTLDTLSLVQSAIFIYTRALRSTNHSSVFLKSWVTKIKHVWSQPSKVGWHSWQATDFCGPTMSADNIGHFCPSCVIALSVIILRQNVQIACSVSSKQKPTIHIYIVYLKVADCSILLSHQLLQHCWVAGHLHCL